MTKVQTESPPIRQRVRLTYEKGENIKFISHQDEFRMWERTLRRANLPLLYKQGFNPQPHIQFAAPLGLGMTGRAEIVDVTFSPPVPLEELVSRIRAKLPPGATLHGAEEVPLKAPALQAFTIGADYTILLYAEPEEIPTGLIQERIDEFLDQEEIWMERERRGERYRYNLRPLVFELKYEGYDAEREEHRIFLRVQMRPGATGRPDAVVSALGFDDFARTLRRERVYFSHRPEDVALFSGYPVIDQESISPGDQPKRRKRKGKRKRTRRSLTPDVPAGRTIAERAKDEFV
jgi:radical SAM-linked protein